MKKISKILRQALRKSAEELINHKKEFIYEGSWCDKHAKELAKNPFSPQPSIITEQSYTCNPYQSRIPNDWSSPGPADACAGSGKAAECANIDPNYNGSIWDLCTSGMLPGTSCLNYGSTIKLFPPTLTPSTTNECEGGWPAVVGDHMLSKEQNSSNYDAWLIVQSGGWSNNCAGPRASHHECNWTSAGCMDNTALMGYSWTYTQDCTFNTTYPANCVGGATGPECCCTYQGPGCTDPNANNFILGMSPDDGSCEYEGCTDPTALNYDFTGSSPQVTANNDPYDGDPSTGNGGTAIDNGTCTPVELGCTDTNASNTTPNANTDDDSCEYEGCTDPTMSNYSFAGSSPQVTANNDPYSPNPPNTGIAIDNGSCTPFPIPGCTDTNASNTTPNANTDDGSCTYLGCTDPSMSNYDFPNSSPQVTATNDPYDGDPSTGNGGFAIDNGSCIPPVTYNCQDGFCEDPGDGSGQHASLSDCVASEECDRWKCTKVITQDDTPMEEQLGPDLKPSKDKPEPTTTSSESTSCIKCDDGDYDLTTGWSTECQFREEEECKEKCKIKCQCCVKNQPVTMVTQVPYDPGCLVLNGINGASECEEFTVNGIHPQYCKDVDPCYEFDNSDPYWNQCCEMCQQTSTGTLMSVAPAHCEGKCHCCGDCQGVITSHGGVSFCEDCFQYNNTPNNDPFGTGVPDPDCVCCDQYNYQGYNPNSGCPSGYITYNNFNPNFTTPAPWWGWCYGCLMSTGALPPDPVFSSIFSYQPSPSTGPLGNCECCEQEIPSWGFIPNWEEEFAGGPLDPSPLVAPSSTDDLGGVDLDKMFQTDDEYSNPEDEYKDEYEVEDEFDLDNALSTLQEGVQLKGKLLNKLRMTKLAGIKKK